MKSARWLFVVLLLAGMLAAIPAPVTAGPATPAASLVAAPAPAGLSSYDITAKLDPKGSIAAVERLRYLNSTGTALENIAFRLYPNADYYGAGSLTVNSALVDGRAVTPVLSVEDTAMTLSFGSPLKPGGSVDIMLGFTTVVPLDSIGSFGIFTRHSDTGDWILCDWNPIVAGRDQNGWRLDPPGAGGDPTFSDSAYYRATITAPRNMTVISSGAASKLSASGSETTWTVARTPLREFTFIVSPSMKRFDETSNGHLVSVFLHPSDDQAKLATILLNAASRAIATYEPLFGAYPYRQLDVLDVPLAGALGVSWTGLLFVNGDLLFPNAVADPERLDFTVAHEVSHQWWGALVGMNTNDHAFLAEGMANCSAMLFFFATQSPADAATQLSEQIAQPYLYSLAHGPDGDPDRPSAATAPGPSLGVLIYGKAALGFLAIRQALGPAAFAKALTAFVTDFSWRIAQPGDLRAEFQAQTDQKLGPLWTKWFESATVTTADVQALVSSVTN